MTASGVFSRSLHDLLQFHQHLAVKPLARELRRVRTNRCAIPRAALRIVERGAQRVYRRVLEKNPCGAVYHGVANTAGAERHDGRAEGHCLQWSDAETFDAGKDQALCAAEVIDDDVPRYVAEALNVGSAAGAERVEQRTAADDDEPAIGGGVDGQFDMFVGNECGNDDVE